MADCVLQSTIIHQYLYGDGQTLGVKPFERYASFDYCFSYFESSRERGMLEDLTDAEHMQTICLQLGFFVASWGLFRGKAFLLGRCDRHGFLHRGRKERLARAQ